MVGGVQFGGARSRSRGGVALLLTLLILVGATLLAHAAFLLALGEGQGVTRQRQLLEGWAAVEEGLEVPPGSLLDGSDQFLELSAGYMLQWMEVDLPLPTGVERGPSLQGGRLWWRLDARAETARILANRQGARRFAPRLTASGENPSLRLGALALDDWLRLVPWEALDHAGQTVAYRYPHGDTGPSVVWAPGALELPRAGLPFLVEGLLLVEEELELHNGSAIHGGVVTGGGMRLMDGMGGLIWDASHVEAALSLLSHALGTRSVPHGWLSPFPW